MKKCLVVIIFFLFFSGLFAQQDSLRVGLVLSGGGAKGIAHIAFLKVMEKTGLNPYALTGTSMGAIVGAYYLAGYSADEILEKIKNIDQDKLMTDAVDRRYLPLRIKKRGRDKFFYLPVDTKTWKIHLPSGLTNYQIFYNKLFKDLFNIQYISDSLELGIPFTFVATDLVTGQQVHFSKGSIPLAVVSSSAFPSIVSPIKIKGTLLTDGGVLNNYPLYEVYKLGANYSIGIDVQDILYTQKQIKDIPSIFSQIMSFYIYGEMPSKIKHTDLYIQMPTAGIGVMDFQLADSIYIKSLKKSLQFEDTLIKLTLHSSKNRQRKSRGKNPDSLYFKSIQIESDQFIDKEFISWKSGIEEKKKIGFNQFMDGINYLYGTGDYKHIYYWIKPGDTLVMNIQKDTVSLRVKTAAHYNSLYKINILTGFIYKRSGGRSVLDAELILGDPIRYNLDLVRDNGYHFGVGFHSSLHKFGRDVSYSTFFPQIQNPSFNNMNIKFSQWTNKVYLQTTLSTNLHIQLGMEHKYYEVYTNIFSNNNNDLLFYFTKDHFLGSFLEFYYDDLDDYYFPEHGVAIDFSIDHFYKMIPNYLNQTSFDQVHFKIIGYRRHNKSISSSYSLETGFVTGQTISDAFYRYIGGDEQDINFIQLTPFYSRKYLNFRTPSYLLFDPRINIRFKKYHYLELGTQAIIYETGDVRLKEFSFLYNVYLRYGIKTFFGPVFVTSGWEPQTDKFQVHLSLGYKF